MRRGGGADRVRSGSSTRATTRVAALQALGWALVVLLLTLSCAVRSSAVHALPPVAFSTVVACLGIFAIQAVIEAVPSFGRPVRRTRAASPPPAVEPVAELRRAS